MSEIHSFPYRLHFQFHFQYLAFQTGYEPSFCIFLLKVLWKSPFLFITQISVPFEISNGNICSRFETISAELAFLSWFRKLTHFLKTNIYIYICMGFLDWMKASWCFQGVEEGWIGNEWVNKILHLQTYKERINK